jgi:hypothetical protein
MPRARHEPNNPPDEEAQDSRTLRIAIPKSDLRFAAARPVTGRHIARLDLVPCQTTFGVSLIGTYTGDPPRGLTGRGIFFGQHSAIRRWFGELVPVVRVRSCSW